MPTVFTELAPIVRALGARKEKRDLQDLLSRAYTGDQEALMTLAQKNPALLTGLNYLSQAATEDFERQQKQETWKQIQDEIETIRRGNVIPATAPTGNLLGFDYRRALTGGSPFGVNFTPGQPERREDLSPQQLAKSQSILNALGVNTGNITGGQLDLARIDEINQKITRGEVLLPYEVDELKQKAMKLDAEAQQAYSAGDLSRAKILREQAETFWLPLTKMSTIGKTNAETGKIQAETGRTQAQTGQIKSGGTGGGILPVYTRDPETGELIQTGSVPKGSKVYQGNPPAGTKGSPLTADQREKLGEFMAALEGDKHAGADKKFWTRQRVKTREQAEVSARKNGLDPTHPEVKKVIDIYFPETAQAGNSGNYTQLSEKELYDKAQAGDKEAYNEAVRRGYVK